MVDNTLALQVQPPQVVNPLQYLLAMSQMRRDDNQNALAQVQLQNAQQMSPLEIGAKKLDLDNKTTETARLRDAETAMRVLGMPEGADRDNVLKTELNSAVAAGKIDEAARDRFLSLPVDQQNKVLQNRVQASVTPQQFIELQQKQQGAAAAAGGANELFGTPAGTSPAAASAVSPPSYLDTLKKAESGGVPNARPPVDPATGKPASSATGLYQFTDATWAGLAKKNPELGLTPDGRTDPVQQEKAVRALTADNAAALAKADLPLNNRNLYMMHFLGENEGKTFIEGVKAAPNAPATSLVSPETVKANPKVFLDSAGQPKSTIGVYNALTNRFGSGAVALAGDNVVPIPSQASALFNGKSADEVIKIAGRVMSNPTLPAESKKFYEMIMQTALDEAKGTPDIREYNFDMRQRMLAGKPQTPFDDWKEASDKRKQQQVTVNAFQNPVLKGISDRFNTQAAKADSSADEIRAIHMAREQLDTGPGIVSGAPANILLGVKKLGTALGIPDEKVASTETFSAAIGARTLELVKGLGAGAGISNADRDFAAKMSGGNITLDESSIRRILDIGERAARAHITTYNTQADRLAEKMPEEGKAFVPLLKKDLPPDYKKPEAATTAPAAPTLANPYEAEMRRRGLLAGSGSAAP